MIIDERIMLDRAAGLGAVGGALMAADSLVTSAR
jgi:hypothetical protein